MQVDWTPLRRELARHRARGMALRFWWRDDDATKPSAALDQLENTADALNVPVHLAIIPALAEASLAQHVKRSDHLVPIVHGWQHKNHAPSGQKKAEFGAVRSGAIAELQRALDQMRQLFGTGLVPVFVPPWNRIDPSYLAPLADAGYAGLSTFTPRQTVYAANGLMQINTHIDPIDWRSTRGLKDPATLVAQTVEVLAARADGQSDSSEPLGYLTHHLVHTADVWDFTQQFVSELLDGGALPQPIAPLLEKHR